MARPTYSFTIPSLPKPAYLFAKELMDEHTVSDWHVVLMGLRALKKLPPAKRRAIRDSIVADYPYPGAPACR